MVFSEVKVSERQRNAGPCGRFSVREPEAKVQVRSGSMMAKISLCLGVLLCMRIYEETSRYCPRLICTRGKDGVHVIDHGNEFSFSSRPIVPVSTIGAGDNFNAGIIYGLLKENIYHTDLDRLDEARWKILTGYGIEFGSEACMSTSNYISPEFAQRFKL